MLNQIEVDQVFHALSDPTRRTIVERLSLGPASITELAKPIDITLSAVVQHIQILEQSGIVHTTKIGRVRSCRINATGLDVAARWIDDRRALWERRFDRLGLILDADD